MMHALSPQRLKLLITSLFVAFVAATTSSPAHGQADACASDVDGDGVVSGADLSLILGSWGPCKTCNADVNGDHLVDGVDLAFVLTRWGGTCAPTVIGLTPDAGPLAGGVSVTIAGNNLLNPLSVTFGGAPATVVGSSRSAISVVAPSAVQGVVPVVVTTRGGAAPAGLFTYYGAPTLSSASPGSGCSVGGSVVTILGSNFYGNPTVSFDGQAALAVSLQSPSQITAVAPPNSAQTNASISVATISGSTTLQSAFSYLPLTVPSWASVLEAAPDPEVVPSVALRNRVSATALPWRVRHTDTGVEMVLIPPGSFSMGCSPSDLYSCDSDESPIHEVTLTNPYYIGRYELTQAQWSAVMGTNPAYFQPPNTPSVNTSRPIEMVSWNEMPAFFALSGLRLPTEAEWEFACRASTSTAFPGFLGSWDGTDDDSRVGEIAWFASNSASQTHTVGQKPANGFGLYDMTGNVWEWVSDWYGAYSSGAQVNPTGPASNIASNRVLRGGSWSNVSGAIRSSNRAGFSQAGFHQSVGFRVARNP